jgi:hypothetical protein
MCCAMLKDHAILYDGTSWPTAEVVARHPLVTKFAPPAGHEVRPGFIFTLTATGKGKEWSTTRPLAFWRDFTAVAHHDSEAVVPMLAFVRRWGDPRGKINGKDGAAESWDWLVLTASLLHIAQAWDAPDADGVSYYGNDLARLREAHAHWRNFLFPNFIQGDVEFEVDPAGGTDLVVRAKTLAAFMGLSASSAMARAVPMRRCQYCTGWFELGRRDARFCSASCRAHKHASKRSSMEI